MLAVIVTIMIKRGRFICSAYSYSDNTEYICSANSYCGNNLEINMQCKQVLRQ
jgi:hypothetical protein